MRADTLSSAAGLQCTYTTTYNYTSLSLSQPKWLDTMQSLQALQLSFTLTLQSGLMGFHFMFIDQNNHFFFLLDALSATIQFGAMKNGVQTRQGTVAWASSNQVRSAASVLSLLLSTGIYHLHRNCHSCLILKCQYTAGCLSFHPMAQCVVHALKGMACRARPSCAR